MPSYSVNQADNLLTAGSVSMPSYSNGSLSHAQYPCSFVPPDLHARPKAIPLGSYENNPPPPIPFVKYDQDLVKEDVFTYDQPNEDEIKEHYVHKSQHQKCGEFSDLEILMISVGVFVFLIICTYLSFQMK